MITTVGAISITAAESTYCSDRPFRHVNRPKNFYFGCTFIKENDASKEQSTRSCI